MRACAGGDAASGRPRLYADFCSCRIAAAETATAAMAKAEAVLRHPTRPRRHAGRHPQPHRPDQTAPRPGSATCNTCNGCNNTAGCTPGGLHAHRPCSAYKRRAWPVSSSPPTPLIHTTCPRQGVSVPISILRRKTLYDIGTHRLTGYGRVCFRDDVSVTVSER